MMTSQVKLADEVRTDSSVSIVSASSSRRPSTPTDQHISSAEKTPSTNNKSPAQDGPYSYMLINSKEWEKRIQDAGVYVKGAMPNKCYRSKQIPAFGPNKKNYYHLTSIAIDYMQHFIDSPHDWLRVPKNVTNVKNKIIELLLSHRTTSCDDSKFHLDQLRFVMLLNNLWGGEKIAAEMVGNDKLRVFGLLLGRESNKYILHRLSKGVTDRSHLDDPLYSPKEMFQHLALDFNNHEIHVDLPDNVEDIEEFMSLDANDLIRINIIRDCELQYLIFFLYFFKYLNNFVYF